MRKVNTLSDLLVAYLIVQLPIIVACLIIYFI